MPESRQTVFISAVSRDLQSYREVVKEQLITGGVFPVVQGHFPPDHRKLDESLADKIRSCDAVICMAGFELGDAPRQQSGERLRSYTQLEYDHARRLMKPIYVFMATESYEPDRPRSDNEGERILQQEHRAYLLNEHTVSFFSSIDELRLLTAHLIPVLPKRREFDDVLPLQGLQRPKEPLVFAGRRVELRQLTEVLQSSAPCVVAVVGIGGQGKTTLVSRWLQSHGRQEFAAVFWCTADSTGITFDLFLDEALTYLLEGVFDKRQMPEVSVRLRKLLHLLQERPTLIILDAVERWLRGWNQGSLELPDAETAEQRMGHFEGLDDFLSQATAISNGTHVICTSRALPAVLDDAQCAIVPVYQEGHRVELEGLDDTAAFELLRALGVHGEPDEILAVSRSYLNHPLALTILGGLLSKKHAGQLRAIANVSALDSRRRLFELFEEARSNLPGRPLSERFLQIAAHSLEPIALEAIVASLRSTPNEGMAFHPEEPRELAISLWDWHLIEWDGERDLIGMHPLLKQYWMGSVANSHLIHRALSRWYESQEIDRRASAIDQVRPRILAIEHGVRGDEVERAAELAFSALTPEYSLVEWLSAFGHLSRGIELLGLLADVARGAIRADLFTARAAFERQLGRLSQAVAHLDLAVEYYEGCDHQENADLTEALAGALMNRGNVYKDLVLHDEARVDYDRAIEVLSALGEREHQKQTRLVDALINRGNLLRDMGHLAIAIGDISTAIEIRTRLIGSAGQLMDSTLAFALTSRGNAFADQRKYVEAIEDFNAAIQIHELLLALGHIEEEFRLAHVRVMRGTALSDQGRGGEALGEFDQALPVLRNLVNSGRGELEPTLALASLDRAKAYARLDRWAESLRDSDFAVAAYDRLVTGGRESLEGYLAHALLYRSLVRYEIDDVQGSSEDRARGLSIARQLIKAGQTDLRLAYLGNSVLIAITLAPKDPAQSAALLNEVLDDTELALRGADRCEALELEVRRSLRLLEPVDTVIRGHGFDSARLFRLRELLHK